jgi:hypothetical protein
VYRLRDLPAPERLFHVEYPDMAQAQFPPLAAEAGYAANLPLQFTRFFGREREIAELAELLQMPETRLVTLSGPGRHGQDAPVLAGGRAARGAVQRRGLVRAAGGHQRPRT